MVLLSNYEGISYHGRKEGSNVRLLEHLIVAMGKMV